MGVRFGPLVPVASMVSMMSLKGKNFIDHVCAETDDADANISYLFYSNILSLGFDILVGFAWLLTTKTTPRFGNAWVYPVVRTIKHAWYPLCHVRQNHNVTTRALPLLPGPEVEACSFDIKNGTTDTDSIAGPPRNQGIKDAAMIQ